MATYLIAARELTKIGSSSNPEERFRSIETMNPFATLVAYTKEELEAQWHKRFKAYRMKGEWFNLYWDQLLLVLYREHPCVYWEFVHPHFEALNSRSASEVSDADANSDAQNKALRFINSASWSTAMNTFATKDDLFDMTGYKQPAKQREVLKKIDVHFTEGAGVRVLVMRSDLAAWHNEMSLRSSEVGFVPTPPALDFKKVQA